MDHEYDNINVIRVKDLKLLIFDYLIQCVFLKNGHWCRFIVSTIDKTVKDIILSTEKLLKL